MVIVPSCGDCGHGEDCDAARTGVSSQEADVFTAAPEMFLDHLARVIAHLPRLRVYWRQLPVAGNPGICNRIRLFGDIFIDLKDFFAFSRTRLHVGSHLLVNCMFWLCNQTVFIVCD